MAFLRCAKPIRCQNPYRQSGVADPLLAADCQEPKAVLLSSRSCRRFLRNRRRRFFWSGGSAETSKEREEGRDFEGHLLGCGGDSDGLGLDQFELIVPRVDLDPAPQRKRCDLVDLLRVELRRGG